MSFPGGYEGEMDDVEGLSDATLDRLLAGRAPADEDTLGLSRFAEDLRAAYVRAPATAVQAEHLAAIAGAARLHTDQTQRPASPAPRAGLAPRLPQWRRRLVLSGMFSSITAKIVAASVVATAATGSLAAANLLPAPIQKAVATVAGSVGVDLPAPGKAAALHPDEAARATEILDALVKRVTDAAEQPHEVGTPVAKAAQACADKVSAIAGELAGSAAKITDPAQALSLAQAATAIAQEAVGCAVPKPVEVAEVATADTSGPVVAATAGAAPIVDAVVDCVEGLKPGILRLAEHAVSTALAGDPFGAMTLASRAGSVAGTAQRCAGNVGTAAQTAFALPDPSTLLQAMPALPKLPATLPVKVPAAPLNPLPVPDAPAATPSPAPAPAAAPAPAPAMTPSWWGAIPSMGTVPGADNPAAPWAGMTGSWGSFGQWMPAGPWNPFQPTPTPSR